MKHKLLLLALAIGTIAGYSSALFCHGHRHHAQRSRWKQEVADVCVQAAARHAAKFEAASPKP
jgi:hypothetical protein